MLMNADGWVGVVYKRIDSRPRSTKREKKKNSEGRRSSWLVVSVTCLLTNYVDMILPGKVCSLFPGLGGGSCIHPSMDLDGFEWV